MQVQLHAHYVLLVQCAQQQIRILSNVILDIILSEVQLFVQYALQVVNALPILAHKNVLQVIILLKVRQHALNALPVQNAQIR